MVELCSCEVLQFLSVSVGFGILLLGKVVQFSLDFSHSCSWLGYYFLHHPQASHSHAGIYHLDSLHDGFI